jgi:hypothetical protein
MKRINNRWPAVAAGVLASVAFGATAQAQSSDALIDKLVDKGILTVKEANALREESDKGFTQGYQVKSGMPDWVTSLKLNGDFRGRYEGRFPLDQFSGGADNVRFEDRNLFRYRLRFGATATIKDNIEAGFRLTSSQPVTGGGAGGSDPISGNTTMTSNGSKKPVYFDLAYAKYSPINNADWLTTFTVGKMENPFVFSDMVFDADYTPEGLAQQVAYNLNSKHTLKLNLGEFAINENSGNTKDSYLFGAQLRLDSTWSPKIQTTIGLSGLNITDADQLTVNAVPYQNGGNLREIARGGRLVNNYNPIVVDAAVTYSLDSFPGYKGAFPIRLAADYMNNPGASTANEGYSTGVTFGKSGKKGLWEVSYRYKVLEGDAWYDQLPDSDFGAFYRPQPLIAGRPAPTTGRSFTTAPALASGYAAGTNIRGHIFKASYNPYDSWTLSMTYFLTETIDEPNAKSIPTGRLQIDTSWKF